VPATRPDTLTHSGDRESLVIRAEILVEPGGVEAAASDHWAKRVEPEPRTNEEPAAWDDPFPALSVFQPANVLPARVHADSDGRLIVVPLAPVMEDVWHVPPFASKVSITDGAAAATGMGVLSTDKVPTSEVVRVRTSKRFTVTVPLPVIRNWPRELGPCVTSGMTHEVAAAQDTPSNDTEPVPLTTET
jgi:hypothetical protein